MKYVLIHTKHFGSADRLTARVVNVKTHSYKDVLAKMAELEPEIPEDFQRRVVAALEKAVCDFVSKGEAVNTGLFTVRPSISGTVKEASHLNSSSLSAKVNMKAGPKLKEAASKVSLEFDSRRAVGPRITGVFSPLSMKPCTTLVPGNPVCLRGIDIKITGKDTGVGVYFQNVNTGERIKAGSEGYVRNTAHTIIVVVPSMEDGEYIAQVVTRYRTACTNGANGGNGEPPRTLTFSTPLTVGRR